MKDFCASVKFEIFDIWRKVCPVHHFLQHNRVMGGIECWRAAAGQRRPVYNSFGLSQSHVLNLSLACPALAILVYPPISYHPLPFFLIDPPIC